MTIELTVATVFQFDFRTFSIVATKKRRLLRYKKCLSHIHTLLRTRAAKISILKLILKLVQVFRFGVIRVKQYFTKCKRLYQKQLYICYAQTV